MTWTNEKLHRSAHGDSYLLLNHAQIRKIPSKTQLKVFQVATLLKTCRLPLLYHRGNMSVCASRKYSYIAVRLVDFHLGEADVSTDTHQMSTRLQSFAKNFLREHFNKKKKKTCRVSKRINKQSVWNTLIASHIQTLPEANRVRLVLCVTSMKDLIEKRLASMVDRPWARQLWAMKPAFSSARQIASSPSFQFQLGMFSRWALVE